MDSECSPLLSSPSTDRSGGSDRAPSYKTTGLDAISTTADPPFKTPPSCDTARSNRSWYCILAFLGFLLVFPGSFFLGRHAAWSQVAAGRERLRQELKYQNYTIQQEWRKIAVKQEEERKEHNNWLQERNHQKHLIQEEWRKIEVNQEEERKERNNWAQEKKRQEDSIEEEWRRIEAKHEEERMDHERRQQAKLSWVELSPHEKCLGYGSRMYSARLVNLPFGVNKAEWCMQTDITIHGFEYTSPDFCEVVGGEYYGHWVVMKGEPGCATYFSIMKGKEECVPGVSHLKRYVGKLENFQEKDWVNWDTMCSTTPFALHNQVFERPDRCEHWHGRVGVVGVKEVYDTSCP